MPWLPRRLRLPIIVLSANSGPEDREASAEAGALSGGAAPLAVAAESLASPCSCSYLTFFQNRCTLGDFISCKVLECVSDAPSHGFRFGLPVSIWSVCPAPFPGAPFCPPSPVWSVFLAPCPGPFFET